MSIDWKQGKLDLGPFDIIRTAQIRDTEEVNLDSKALELKNTLDRKWEASALIFSVPKPAEERPWWILAIIVVTATLLAKYDSKTFYNKLRKS